MKLDDLLSITNVAKFLGTPEDNVAELLDDGRLGGILVAALRSKGVPVTPKLKNSVENVVTSLSPHPDIHASDLRGRQNPDAEQVLTTEATATIMFTDIVASTALTDKLGDRLSREVFKIHNDIIRRHTKQHGGAEVKSMGDGFMLTFNSARRALAAAIGAQKELQHYNRRNPDTSLSVRMGLSVGEPIREEEDLFGKSVILAARISAKAKGEQILACPIVHALLAATGEYSFNDMGEHELKGVSGVQNLYEVVWR
ncbi:MAG: adenylate/guanylate cyclase domain-containing protein [Chloroflexi bacterium]|nr:adenylate/guanylate cyclase domain-containing protein [Chloroflexota bacterium]